MSELFTIPETLSPRLKWMREQSIHIIDNGPVGEGESRYCAYQGVAGRTGMFVWDWTGYGQTEDEALVQLCKKLDLLLWNESPGPPSAVSDK